MGNLTEFSIPIKGLNRGIHEFNFHISDDFFKNFEGSTVENGDFDVHMTLDKRDSFFELVFDFEGTMRTECDRCTAAIDLPFGDTQRLTVKHSLETQEEDAEIVYISPEESHFDVSKYIYEFICLAAPLNKTYDCENDEEPPCDFEVLKRLSNTPSPKESLRTVSEEIEDKKNPFQDLKKIFDN